MFCSASCHAIINFLSKCFLHFHCNQRRDQNVSLISLYICVCIKIPKTLSWVSTNCIRIKNMFIHFQILKAHLHSFFASFLSFISSFFPSFLLSFPLSFSLLPFFFSSFQSKNVSFLSWPLI